MDIDLKENGSIIKIGTEQHMTNTETYIQSK